MREKVLILGASGFLGQHIKERFFLDGKYEILSPSRSELNLENFPEVQEYFAQEKPAIIINASGLCGGVLENVTKPADFLFYNTITSLNAIKAASISKPQKYVNISSACSYPDIQTTANLNRSRLKPQNLWDGRPHETHAPYGLAKRFSCEAAQAFAFQYELPAINLILANLYGPGDKFDNPASHVIPAIISRIHKAKEEGHESVMIYGSPNVTREFLYVKDAADAIYTLSLKYSDSKPLNVGSGETVTIGQLAHQIAKLSGFDGIPFFQQENLSGQMYRMMDISELTAFGWQAKTTLENGLKQTIASYQERRTPCHSL